MRAKHRAVFLFSLLGLIVLSSSARGQEDPPLPTVDEVMDHLDDLYRSESSHSMMTMEVVTSDYERTMELEGWTEGEDFALYIIRSPAREAGTGTLLTDEGLWNYAPRADRLMRVPSGLLSEGWMGSHFTNDDLVRDTSYSDDFDTELSWLEEDGNTYLVGTSVPHPDTPVVYTRLDFVMEAVDYIPVRFEYYDGDELVRTMTFSDVQDISGRPVPMRMELIPADEPDERTVVVYDELELDIEIDVTFDVRGLRRETQRR